MEKYKEDFVTYEQAVKLKELGFDGFKWDCDYWYYYAYDNPNERIFEHREITDHYDVEKYWYAPTLSQTQKWLRETKNIDVIVLKYANDYNYKVYYKKMISVTAELFDNYEKALSAGIDEVIDYLIEEI